VALAEKLQAPVITNLTLPAVFPTSHPLHAATPGLLLTSEAEALVAGADVVLSLDWIDLAGTLRQACRQQPFAGRVIHVSCDAHNHRGWSADHFGLAPIDLYLLCEADAAIPLLLQAVAPRSSGYPIPARGLLPPVTAALNLRRVAAALDAATRGVEVCYTRFPLGWHGDYTAIEHPLDSIGYDGGAGIGSGPGMTVGAGMALKSSGRIAVGVVGDGDFLMGNTAIWTAAHYRVPGLLVVCNNRSFYNDERHQERMAELRNRPADNRWIGQHISDPDIDIAALARAQGALGVGPISQAGDLEDALAAGIAAAREGQFSVVDVRVEPGYDARG
jgi:thiamine pyrophosphate-dependent acetolactate synthase large subunit-like protein